MRDSVTSFGEAMDLLWQSPSPVTVKEEKTLEILAKYGLTAKLTGSVQFKILNGCVKNILLYPTTRKLLIQVNGKNYISQANFDTLYDLIVGNLAYKKEGE